MKKIRFFNPYDFRKSSFSALLLMLATAAFSQWTPIGTDIMGSGNNDVIGWSVAISGDGKTVVVGDPGDDSNATNSGVAKVFRKSGNGWVQVGNDIKGLAANDQTGHAVAISHIGSIIAVASPEINSSGVPGRTQVYQEDASGNWVQIGAILELTSGTDVALSADGNRLITSDSQDFGGRVRVWINFGDGVWAQNGQFPLNGENNGDEHGRSIALSADGKTIVAGAPFNSDAGENAGHVRIYRADNFTFFQIGDDIDGEDELDLFGFDVAMSANGKRIAVGAPQNVGSGTSMGYVKVFEENGNGDWVQLGQRINGEIGVFDGEKFGSSVSLSDKGDVLAVGAPFNPTVFGAGELAGEVTVFQLNGGTWEQIGQDINGDSENDNLGGAVALSGDGATLIAGAAQGIIPNANGYARILHFDASIAGDDCESPNDLNSLFGQAIDAPQTSQISDNTFASTELSDPDFGFECFWDNDQFTNQNPSLERTIWYSFIGDGSTYKISTVPCNTTNYIQAGATQLALYSGNCGNLTPVACNENEAGAVDFRAAVEVETQAGLDYRFMVDGWNGQTEITFGEYCVEVIRLAPNSTLDESVLLAELHVSPNPASEYLNVYCGNMAWGKDARLLLFDSFGQLVLEKEVVSKQHQFNVQYLPKGIYWLQMVSGAHVKSKRIILQ